MEVTETTALGGKDGRPRALPLVAVVGRPNVGKSTLFNRLVGYRRAIVHDSPGVTRDRLVAEAEWGGRRFRVSDTGGIEPEAREGIPGRVRAEALRAAAEADVVLLVVDGRQGVTPVDADVARALFRAGSSALVLAVNKIDAPGHEPLAAEFARLGIEPRIAISAEGGLGLPELLDALVARLPQPAEAAAPEEGEEGEEAEREVAVALVGRPNVGKSTLFNRLVGDERSLVSEVAGTTRDTVDVLVERDGLRLRFLDTAGIRRRAPDERGPESLSVVVARRTVERAHVVVLVLDATQPLAHQDAAVAGEVEELGRALVLAATKWDLVGEPAARRRALERELEERLGFLAWAPLVTVSARSGRGAPRLLEAVRRADASHRLRVPTPALNRFAERELRRLDLVAPGARPAHVLYAAQTGVRPPSFVLFVNRRVAPHPSVVRRIANRLRAEFGFEGTPLVLRFRARERKGGRGGGSDGR